MLFLKAKLTENVKILTSRTLKMSDLPLEKTLELKHWSPGQLIYDYDTPSFHAFS